MRFLFPIWCANITEENMNPDVCFGNLVELLWLCVTEDYKVLNDLKNENIFSS